MVAGTFVLLIPFTLARCMRITSRKGSRLMYQPGQAPPGMVCAGALASLAGRTNVSVPTRALVLTAVLTMPAPRFVSVRFFFVASVAGTNGWHCSAMRLYCKKASPHLICVQQGGEVRAA